MPRQIRASDRRYALAGSKSGLNASTATTSVFGSRLRGIFTAPVALGFVDGPEPEQPESSRTRAMGRAIDRFTRPPSEIARTVFLTKRSVNSRLYSRLMAATAPNAREARGAETRRRIVE